MTGVPKPHRLAWRIGLMLAQATFVSYLVAWAIVQGYAVSVGVAVELLALYAIGSAVLSPLHRGSRS